MCFHVLMCWGASPCRQHHSWKFPQCTALKYKTMIQDLWALNDKVLVVMNGFHEALMRHSFWPFPLWPSVTRIVCLPQNLFQKFTMIWWHVSNVLCDRSRPRIYIEQIPTEFVSQVSGTLSTPHIEGRYIRPILAQFNSKKKKNG